MSAGESTATRSRPLLAAALLAAVMFAGCASVGPAPNPASQLAASTEAPGDADMAAPVTHTQASGAADGDTSATDPAVLLATDHTALAAAPAAAEGEPLPAPQLDLPREGDGSDLWQRVREAYALPAFDDPLVRRWEQWYASRPDYVQRMTERGGRYLFHIVEEVEKRGLPSELALLPFIESAFNPQALSRVQAAGMWQFMPATGRAFDLQQNLFRDDRRDVLASTRAALDYLQDLHRQFGDWHLALAAYNWGQGNVRRAIRRNQAARLPTTYRHLRMPAETRNYVPKLMAVVNLIGRPQDFALTLPPLENHPFFLSVPIVRDIDVALVAELAGLEPDDFHALNPQLNKPVILAAGTPQVLLPYDNAHRFAEALAAHDGPLASWTAWVAPTTLTAAAVAQRVGMRETELRRINGIPPGMLVQAGSALLVPRSPAQSSDVSAQVANNGSLSLAPQTRRVVIRIGPKGSSVAWVVQRYGVTAAQVRQWNRNVGRSGRLAPGSRLVLHVPTAASGRQAGSAGRPVVRTPRAGGS
jgi:membrane-bound lytic murein transglycosylase D